MKNSDEIAKGVESAFDFWLSQHDVSVPELIQAAVKKAATDWLEAHSAEIIASIAHTANQNTRSKARAAKR